MKKWKPNKNDINNWIAACEVFKKDISEISDESGVYIKVSAKCQSIYFIYNDKKYRISTHYKPDWTDKFEGMEIVTNSRNNIIKHLKRILQIS